MFGMHMAVQQLLQDGDTPEYMYKDRTAWRYAFFVGKKYGYSKGYPQRNAAHMGSICLWGQHFIVDILCFHIFCPQ
jgi:hypothetical protein